MQTDSLLLRQLPFSIADAPDPRDAWAQSPLAAISDAQLAGAVAAAIATPKRDADSSFLTHAPLELAARLQLLPMVAPQSRDGVLRRIASIAGEYARAGEEIGTAAGRFPDDASAIWSIKRMIVEGDADGADAALLFLIPRVSASALAAALSADLLPMLGAAGHAPILLADLQRLEGRLDGAGALLRAPIAMITREAGLRLRWHEAARADGFEGDAESELFERLRNPLSVSSPSVYIAPTMLAVEADGYAERLLGDVTSAIPVDAAARAILRSAALSMLQDDPASAPYGWTHALTMPLGVFGCAHFVRDERAIVRIAATFALGFRATLGKTRLEVQPPESPRSKEFFGVAPQRRGAPSITPTRRPFPISGPRSRHVPRRTVTRISPNIRLPASRPRAVTRKPRGSISPRPPISARGGTRTPMSASSD